MTSPPAGGVGVNILTTLVGEPSSPKRPGSASTSFEVICFISAFLAAILPRRVARRGWLMSFETDITMGRDASRVSTPSSSSLVRVIFPSEMSRILFT